MEKHESSERMKKDLDNLLSKINALEVSAPDEYQKILSKFYGIWFRDKFTL